MDTLSLTKEARIYNGLKTISLTIKTREGRKTVEAKNGTFVWVAVL